jgi:flagellar hook-associated protein 2
MGSPITFSGFNKIDFGVVLNAIMQQEGRPLQALEARGRALEATHSALTTLAGKLDALRSAAAALTNTSLSVSHVATSSAPAIATVAASGPAVAGQYDIVVSQLARAQVTPSSSTTPDAGTTIVATGGTLTIGGVAVAVAQPVTLQELAANINATAGIPVSAAVIQTAPNAYRLVLTGSESGAANSFTVQNGLAGGTVTFAGNAVEAMDAAALINHIPVTADHNVLSSVIPGVTVTLVSAAPTQTVNVTVARDDESLSSRIQTFVAAYNDVTAFANEQRAAAGKGTQGSIGYDPLLRSLRGSLRSVLLGASGDAGTFHRLSEIGIGFSRTGELTFDGAALTKALRTDAADVYSLLGDSQSGVLTALNSTITEYTQSGGLLPGARTRLTEELSRNTRRIDDMQARLAVRRAALQREFMAADEAMSRLSSQSGSLASFGQNLTSSGL